jgi:hypothetical protein
MRTRSYPRALTTLFILLLYLSSFPTGTVRGQNEWRVGELAAFPGQSRSGFLAVTTGHDGETRIPITIFHGAKPGPTLGLIAGNHGYEYSPILAAQRLISKIDPGKLSGNVILVHVANMPSFLSRTIYYSPVDGKNLNRVYPGRKDGSISERIAYVITKEIIDRSDYLVDLHCGDGNESLRPYSYWMPIENPKVDGPSKQMALAFGLDHIVIDRGRPKDPAASLYCSNTAMTRGKPAITIESGGLGMAYDSEAIARIERGVQNLLRHLSMVEGKVEPTARPKFFEPAEVLRFPSAASAKNQVFSIPKLKKDRW